MSRPTLALNVVKTYEGGRMRVPLSLTVEQVARLDAAAKAVDLDRATYARLLVLAGLRDPIQRVLDL